MEWAIHATVAAQGVKEDDLDKVFGPQEDFSYFDLGGGVWGGVEVSAPRMLEVYTRSEDLCQVMAVLIGICRKLTESGFEVRRLSIEAIPLG